MNTAKTHVRFWNAMTERYGRRWTEQYGLEASPAWRDLVNKFSLDDIKAALARLGDVAPEFPPTLPQFESALAKVSNAKRIDSTNYVRGYWRSMIVLEVASNLGYTMRTLEPFIVANRRTLGESMRMLLDEMESVERRVGQRTEGMLDTCRDKCLEITEAFPQLESEHAFQRVMREKRGMARRIEAA